MSSDADFRRLRIAARAFHAARPSEAEVERGVRKALSTMRRSRPHRRPGIATTLALAILAFATLSYARPSELRVWLKTLFGSAAAGPDAKHGTRGGRALSASDDEATGAPEATPAAGGSIATLPSDPLPQGAVALAAAPSSATAPPGAAVTAVPGSPAGSKLVALTPPGAVLAHPRNAPLGTGQRGAGSPRRATWAEVSSALLRDDTHGALVALADLAEHGNAATRAKAELGLAQLHFAHGNRNKACGMARTLVSTPNVEQRIQERAQRLLDECSR